MTLLTFPCLRFVSRLQASSAENRNRCDKRIEPLHRSKTHPSRSVTPYSPSLFGLLKCFFLSRFLTIIYISSRSLSLFQSCIKSKNIQAPFANIAMLEIQSYHAPNHSIFVIQHWNASCRPSSLISFVTIDGSSDQGGLGGNIGLAEGMTNGELGENGGLGGEGC